MLCLRVCNIPGEVAGLLRRLPDDFVGHHRPHTKYSAGDDYVVFVPGPVAPEKACVRNKVCVCVRSKVRVRVRSKVCVCVRGKVRVCARL